MDNEKKYIISVNEIPDIDKQDISKILLKNGEILEINSKLIDENEYSKVNNNNYRKNYNYYDEAKEKKFRTLSYKNNGNYKFCVTQIPNSSPKFLAIRSKKDEFDSENKYVKNYTFKSAPLRYNYKPYKQPRRGHPLHLGNKYLIPNSLGYYSRYPICTCMPYNAYQKYYNCPYCQKNSFK